MSIYWMRSYFVAIDKLYLYNKFFTRKQLIRAGSWPWMLELRFALTSKRSRYILEKVKKFRYESPNAGKREYKYTNMYEKKIFFEKRFFWQNLLQGLIDSETN